MKLCQKPPVFIRALMKPPGLFEPSVNITGTIIIACAKMIGITPAAFTFRGRY